MTNKPIKSIRVPAFISILGNEFMLHTGYGVYAFLTHQSIYGLYAQYSTDEVSAHVFARKLVKEYFHSQ